MAAKARTWSAETSRSRAKGSVDSLTIDDVGAHVQVHELSVDSGREQDARGPVGHPPLVAVVAARVPQSALGAREGFATGFVGMAGVVDPRRRHDLFGVPRAASQVHEPEATQVAQGHAETSVGRGVAVPVHRDARIVLSAQAGPHQLAHEVGEARTPSALDDPAQQVGEDRAVLEDAAVRAVVAERERVAEEVEVVTARRRAPARGTLVATHVGLGVVVLLGELRAGRHVKDLAHGGAGERRVLELGHVLLCQALRREHAAAREYSREGAGQRLGDRLKEVSRGRRHAVEVLLGDDALALKHEEAVGVRSREERPHGEALSARRLEGRVIDGPRIARRARPRGRRRARCGRWG